MNKYILIMIILISANSHSQQLTCENFKNGTFIIPADETLPISIRVERNGNNQTEIILNPEVIDAEDLELRKTFFEIIEWIDDCSYRITYNETKMTLDEHQKFVNENGGLLVEMVKIEGSCFYYMSSIDVDGEVVSVNGKLCKAKPSLKN
ncbi:hypothetical protein MWU58_14410 [Flavobacteriaceae bacterium S0825]|uniref:hypothetical protein n=1 Tax=Gaetbulibacter sp. S0825 TaxID=2720084 RepID=UPI0014310156|nr:hypothetical protein [Gaetbulibacter sp. S0825]MCK0110488.1 hypothetical protein [Flavobacteriaceae bacterium S0825]NIX66117.1 hypothetical protein [Gaetbulibacter sp. S0825]